MKSAFYSRKTASTETGDVTDNWERPPLRNLLLGDILFVCLIPDIRIMVNPVKRSLEAKVSNKNEVTETNVNDDIFEAIITDYQDEFSDFNVRDTETVGEENNCNISDNKQAEPIVFEIPRPQGPKWTK